MLTEGQKHTSSVAKIHYQKLNSENTAIKAKSSLDKLRNRKKAKLQI